MGRKTLWIDGHNGGQNYGIDVPADQPVFQVHRHNMGIDFASNAQAMKSFSPNAYMLYMLLVARYPNRVWTLSPALISKNTTLSPDEIAPALQELIEQDYWTQGEISLTGRVYRSNSFHIWESPEMNQP